VEQRFFATLIMAEYPFKLKDAVTFRARWMVKRNFRVDHGCPLRVEGSYPAAAIRELYHSRYGTRMTGTGLGRVKTFRPRETGDAKLNLAWCRTCELESRWFARSAASDLVAPMRMPMRTPHAWIAAMSGFTCIPFPWILDLPARTQLQR
jgi:hypothetical protein